MTDNEADRAMYPMRIVTRMTGLNADTIRSWERRHHAVEPARSGGNTRLFSAGDIQRLNLLRQATEAGHPIGQVAKLDEAALEALVDAAPSEAEITTGSEDDSGSDDIINRYLEAVSELGSSKGQHLLQRAALLLPPPRFVLDVVLPLLREVGKRWAGGNLSVAEEHLVSVHLTGMLGTMLRFYPPDRGAPRVFITTPAGERHGFGALSAALLGAARGLDVVYFGTDLPDEDLYSIASQGDAAVVLLGLVIVPAPRRRDELTALFERVGEHTEIWLGGPSALALEFPRQRYFHNFETLDVAFASLARRA